MKNPLILASLAFLLSFGWTQTPGDFDGDTALDYLRTQCAFGPRNPGSTGYFDCRDWLIRQLATSADTVIVQPFQLEDPFTAEVYDLSNLIAIYGVDKAPGILLGAHWDTRPWGDEDEDSFYHHEPILGANDGASGVAVLLTIGTYLEKLNLPYQVMLVLFDGEDLGQPGDPRSYARGSAQLAQEPPVPLPPEGIVLDMVGDKELKISMERNSYFQNPPLVRELWALARTLELKAFRNLMGLTIYDDHIPLYRDAGVRMVDLIDFEYPNSAVNYWHTHLDVPENCSAESLDQVGTLVLNFLINRGRKD